MFARVRSATAASIAILFAITGIAACGGSDDDSTAAAADTAASAPTTVATGWQDDVEAYCDKLVAGLDSVPEPEPTPEGLATFIGALQAGVADLPGLDTITVPADMQEDWDRHRRGCRRVRCVARCRRAGERRGRRRGRADRAQ